MTASPASLARAPKPGDGVRALVVDDSAVVRGLTGRWLREAPGVAEVVLAIDGRDGVNKAREMQPDVVVLDVEMPRMDGLAALPEILKAAPGVHVVMASTLTQRNADITLRAMTAGATDYIPKPESGHATADAYRRDVVAKVLALGAATRKRRAYRANAAAAAGARPAAAPVSARPVVQTRAPVAQTRPRVLAIGSSTGGPQALRDVIGGLSGKITAPVLITQHMPATFTTILAEHLDKVTTARAVEAQNGMPVEANTIYVAPGDYHMTVRGAAGGGVTILLDQKPPENFCRPAVDPLFRSVAKVYRDAVLAVVLTGMGHDGAAGARDIVNAGGQVIAQDEASSVVWGMPGAVAREGLASAIKPLASIAGSVGRVFEGMQP